MGETVAAIGLEKTTTGDTLCQQKRPHSFGKFLFPEPVIFLVEPQPGGSEKLAEALGRLMEEDPTFK